MVYIPIIVFLFLIFMCVGAVCVFASALQGR